MKVSNWKDISFLSLLLNSVESVPSRLLYENISVVGHIPYPWSNHYKRLFGHHPHLFNLSHGLRQTFHNSKQRSFNVHQNGLSRSHKRNTKEKDHEFFFFFISVKYIDTLFRTLFLITYPMTQITNCESFLCYELSSRKNNLCFLS